MPLAGVVALQLAAVYVPPLSTAFLRTVPLTAQDLGITVAAGLILFAAIELEKWIIRRMRSARLQLWRSLQPYRAPGRLTQPPPPPGSVSAWRRSYLSQGKTAL